MQLFYIVHEKIQESLEELGILLIGSGLHKHVHLRG
uniref:Uncharacterized protein n=1 Tax=Arundo donax TaxID=35708 RepID=A0A0A9U407_ARUDO